MDLLIILIRRRHPKNVEVSSVQDVRTQECEFGVEDQAIHGREFVGIRAVAVVLLDLKENKIVVNKRIRQVLHL